jgi:SAM-dependent methyltransferase
MKNESYLKTYHSERGLGLWRSLYLQILRHMPAESILEAGAGSPAFLAACPMARKTAVDIADDHAEAFRSLGISFAVKNLDVDTLGDLGVHDVIVCSDVFEHLLHPLFALNNLRDILTADGLLFSHVPNEFSLNKLSKIMLGRKTTVNFHKQSLPEEWNDPHVRRFSKIGYMKMLEHAFAHNICITQFRYSRIARVLHAMLGAVPYTLEKGPTFVSTNSAATAAGIRRIIQEHKTSLARNA